MGYEPEETLYKLRFEDEKYAGLEVTMGELSVDEFLDVAALADEPAAGEMTAEKAASLAASTRDLLGQFARHLVSWNVTRRGEPVPATREGVGTQQLGFLMEIIKAWVTAAGGVEPPLPPGSPNGATALEESLGLASLSSSLPS